MLMQFVFVSIISTILAVWVYMDAIKRGFKPLAALGWFLGVFLAWIIFFPLYMFLRTRRPKPIEILTPCKYCGKYYQDTPLYCPNCGHKVGGYSFKEE